EWVTAPWLPPFILIALLVVGWWSDVSGLHPAIGAFAFGLAMPRSDRVEAVRLRLEPVAVNVLLPLYFVSTGLSTSIGLSTPPAGPPPGRAAAARPGCPAKGRDVLAGGGPHRPLPPRRPGHRCADERTRPRRAGGAQHRPPAPRHHAGAVLDHGRRGGPDDDD